MSFLETLDSVGGIKSCVGCLSRSDRRTADPDCPHCHGTDRILDLAPLLAKPRKLEDVTRVLYDLLMREKEAGRCLNFPSWEVFVVGPQRASSVIHMVAYQLSGTAVTLDPYKYKIDEIENIDNDENDHAITVIPYSYRLSIPLPDNTVVLFVTDRLGPTTTEMVDTVMAVRLTPGVIMLPYLLCLVDSRQETGSGLCPVMMDHRPFNILYLHQENPPLQA